MNGTRRCLRKQGQQTNEDFEKFLAEELGFNTFEVEIWQYNKSFNYFEGNTIRRFIDKFPEIHDWFDQRLGTDGDEEVLGILGGLKLWPEIYKFIVKKDFSGEEDFKNELKRYKENI